MNESYKYYEAWYLKWVRLFRKIYDKFPLSNRKAMVLCEKIKKHFWNLERRLLAYRWFEEKAEKSYMWVPSLKE